jgi:hypothetical protein
LPLCVPARWGATGWVWTPIASVTPRSFCTSCGRAPCWSSSLSFSFSGAHYECLYLSTRIVLVLFFGIGFWLNCISTIVYHHLRFIGVSALGGFGIIVMVLGVETLLARVNCMLNPSCFQYTWFVLLCERNIFFLTSCQSSHFTNPFFHYISSLQWSWMCAFSAAPTSDSNSWRKLSR